MAKGFSLIETLISLTLSLFILLFTSIFVDSIKKESLKGMKEMEDLLELFSGIDRISYEIKRCGLGLSSFWENENFKFLIITEDTISLRRWGGCSLLMEKAYRGEKKIYVENPSIFKEGREILITDSINFENNRVSKIDKKVITLSDTLKNDYPEDSKIILINFISFKYDRAKRILRMSQNSGTYQPLIENVEGFSLKKDGSSIILSLLFNKKTFYFQFFMPFGGGI